MLPDRNSWLWRTLIIAMLLMAFFDRVTDAISDCDADDWLPEQHHAAVIITSAVVATLAEAPADRNDQAAPVRVLVQGERCVRCPSGPIAGIDPPPVNRFRL